MTGPDYPENPDQGESDRALRGIALLLIATLLFATQDAFTKQLVQSLPASQIVAVRFFFFALFVIAYAARKTGIRIAFKSQRPGLQLARGLLISSEIVVFAYAIQFLGLAEMHTLFACFPLLITALSVPFLGETVGWRRWLAVFFGFLGTIIILRPGFGIFQPAAAFALIAAFMFSIYNILTRKVSRYDRFETSLVYMGVAGLLTPMAIAPFYWTAIAPDEMVWLLLLSAAAIAGHLLLIKALELAPTVILQPFNYFVLVWAILLGYILYDEVLPPTSVLGAVIVVGSGVFIARREYKLSRASRAVAR